MRLLPVLLAGAAFTGGTSAYAADALKFGAPPSWVVPQPIPAGAKPTDGPVAVLLSDEQIAFEPGKVTRYQDGAIRIQNAQGLTAAGNLALAWDPATETVTVNKLSIIRGGKVIDVLASGQTFTTLRRETNLDAATLDGTLTATIQPEDLQEGDILELATTTERSDPVLKDHVEAAFADWNGTHIDAAHSVLSWPASMKVSLKQWPSLPPGRIFTRDGRKVLELSGHDLDPVIPPSGAPLRFQVGRVGEATDFDSWDQVSELMLPLYRKAALIPSSGPLHDEVEKIRAASSDPKTRAEQALALVENRVRYVALEMGQGGYVPAPAELTWSRRFGDCKGKSVLLLAILQSLGIQSEPVLVQALAGDIVGDRLPMVGLFNHVIVRAHIGDKTYWLDGTRTGDTDLDGIEVPDFGWVLPLTANASLVHLVPPPLDLPAKERHLDVDARSGLFAPATIAIKEIYRGDSAIAFNDSYSAVSAQQRDEALRDNAREFFDTFAVSSSSIQFDKAKRELTITIQGTAKVDWKDGWAYIPTSSIGFNPDFDRPPGPNHDAPFEVTHPRYVRDLATFRLPADVAARQKLVTSVHETLAGVEYERKETANADSLTVESSERSLAPEVTYGEAVAAAPQLKALSDNDLYLNAPGGYQVTDADLAELEKTKPETAYYYFIRALGRGYRDRKDEALADLNAGLALDPKNAWGLVKRSNYYIQNQQFAEAESDLKAAESVDAANSDLAVAWGDLAVAKGDFATAVSQYDKALVKDPNNAWAHIRRAGALERLGRGEDALKDLDSAIAADPRNVGALTFRAGLLASKEEWDLAKKDIDAALAIDPENGAALASEANIQMQRKDYGGAEALVTKALQHDPENTFARHLQAQLLKRSEGEDQAIHLLDQAVANAPRDATALLSRASAYLAAKNYESAEKDVEAVLKINPDDPRALEERGSIALAKGDYNAAIEALTTDLQKFPSNGSALQERAEAYRAMRNYDLALADTDAALKVGLVSPELRLLRINILVQQGDLAKVEAEADQLVKENSTSDFALVAAGKTYAALGIRQKAMESFDRALAIKPYPYIYINRSQIRPYSDFEGKLADLDKALAIEPNDEDVLATKAWLLLRHGRNAEAVQLYDKAIATALDGSYLQLSRAVALQRAGRSVEAAKIFGSERAKAKTAPELNRICWAKATGDVLLESAEEDCREALRLDPTYNAATDSLALVLLKLRRFKESMAEYDKAIANHSGAEAFMGRAIARSRMGDEIGATADATQARKLRPDIDDTFAEYGLKLDPPTTTDANPATRTAAK
jgi:tetratricopeptide (TPR) repeat protein/transglutaminase-like putative cysteine protease